MDKKFKLVALNTIIIITIMCTACSSIDKSEEVTIEEVLLNAEYQDFNEAVVERSNIVEYHGGIGVARIEEAIDLKAPHNARIEEIYVEYDSIVKAGDPIAKLYSEELDEKISLQEITVSSQEIKYEKVQKNGDSEYVVQLELNNLQKEKKLLQDLLKEKESLTIKSPIEGYVKNLTQKKVNSEVSEYESIASINSFTFTIKAENPPIYETDLIDFINIYYAGMDAVIRINGKEYEGEVEKVYRENECFTASKREVIFKIPNEDILALNHRSKINYQVTGESKKNVLVIPANAVYRLDEEFYVYVVEDGIKNKRYIKIGMVNPDMVEVVSGLKEGEIISIDKD